MATPTRTTVNQTYLGDTIQCAMFYCPSATSFKLKDVCRISTDYIFQAVIKSTTARTVTVKLGNQTKTMQSSTSFQKRVLTFTDVDVSESTDAYIEFQSGTYYLWNVQIEQATTPSGWRPAPEDATDYTDAQMALLDQQEIFDRLTHNGQTQGLYLQNGKLYINASYVKAGILSGVRINNGSGTFTVDENGNVTANSLNSSNANITGGSLNINTSSETDDVITLNYSSMKTRLRSGSILAENTYTSYGVKYQYKVVITPERYLVNQDGYTRYMFDITPTLTSRFIHGTTNTVFLTENVYSPREGSSKYGGASFNLTNSNRSASITLSTIRDEESDEGYIGISTSGVGNVNTSIRHNKIQMTQHNGTASGIKRVVLDETGLYFYNSSGTLTKSYLAT